MGNFKRFFEKKNGVKICDFEKNNISILNYSKKVRLKTSFKNLKNNIFTIPSHPDLRPYVTSYYKKNWGFSVPYKIYKNLKNDEILDAQIESKFKNGSVDIGVKTLKGKKKKISYFDKRIKKKLPKISSINKIEWNKINLVFLSLPNGEAQKLIKKIFFKFKNLKFIDLSADFRIENSKIYENNYKLKHRAKNLIKQSLYSIPELLTNPIDKYRIISNPGCYPTSIQLPLIPLIKRNLINCFDIIIDSKSGYSGAGKNLEKKFKHKNLYSSTFAYSPKSHRHICEIDQQIFKQTKKKLNSHLILIYFQHLEAYYFYICKG